MSTRTLIDQAIAKAGSQEKLADLLGLKQQNISALRTGKRHTTTDLRVKLAKIADYDLKVALIEQAIEDLDPTDEVQAEAGAMLQAVIDAFPNAGYWRRL
ncbi:helix-turn-helix domain-containing protein [Delftia lacustris]|uniref:Methionine biosynthesis protein MetW n=1 Tax=Delftia lacustris TaxID=558537 RepID=A0A1H3MBD1_9BURK|nr:YdaS family helix-turn-helix protein [Delftia lacustris]SDY73893.1 Methionine biosynthesis protein MetW [Delftia lacustris]